MIDYNVLEIEFIRKVVYQTFSFVDYNRIARNKALNSILSYKPLFEISRLKLL